MRTLVFGAGPIGRWLALRLRQAGTDITLLAMAVTHDSIQKDGVVLIEGLTGEKKVAQVKHARELEILERDPSNPSPTKSLMPAWVEDDTRE